MTEDLAKRIDRLESIEAIKKLKHVYMNFCDLGAVAGSHAPLSQQVWRKVGASWGPAAETWARAHRASRRQRVHGQRRCMDGPARTV